MRSRANADFWKRFDELPHGVQMRARAAYRLFVGNAQHPSLMFKKLHASEPFYSVRIGLKWRAVGRLEGDLITWFWIGHHGEYDRLLAAL